MKLTKVNQTRLDKIITNFFKQDEYQRTVCVHDVIEALENELTMLNRLIKYYDVEDCPRVKRFGLPIFHNEMLE